MDSQSFISEMDQSLWNSVLNLRPRLRRNIRVVAQEFRGSRWYLLQDENAGRFIRVNNTAYDLIGRFDGDYSIREILEIIADSKSGDQAINAEQVLGVVSQLHEFEALKGGLSVSSRDALRRFNHSQEQKRLQQWGNPLSLRFSLLDPDRLLNALTPLLRWVLSPAGMVAWVLIMLSALMLVLLDHANFTHDIRHQSFGVKDFATFWLLYCAVKALHELGHGLAIKRWGGEVHDAGIFFLVFMPVPYVDGSASLAFRDKRKRALVSAAGILVELFLAALGVLVWSVTEPGLVNDLALKVTLIGGLSTLLYNGNPLLRFDGYYVLEDLVEIPNLASRSSRYYIYLIQRYALGLSESVSPVACIGERKWFLVYGLLSPIYRMLVLLGIALFLTQKYLVVGVILAAWAIYKQVVKTIIASAKYLISNSQLQSRRLRSVAIAVVPLITIVAMLNVPVPLVTRSQGVVWAGDDSEVIVKTGGFVASVDVTSGDQVKAGDIILQLSNRKLESDLKILQSRQSELRTAQAIAQQKSRVEGEIASSDSVTLASQLDALKADQYALTIRSPADGVIVFSDPHELTGKFMREGDLLAFVVQQNHSTIRAVVNQGSVGSLSGGIKSAEIMLASQMGTVHKANTLRETPAGGFRLPSAALGKAVGGPVRTDLSDDTGLTAESEFFQIDLALPADTVTAGIGGRVFVKLYHGNESLLLQWSRKLRQLVLARLAV